jgi:hypothetical protein
VLRLAVSTPQAFHIGVGFQGPSAGMNVPVASASTPRIELVGHYLHLDDGVHVRGGRYPSSPDMLAETVRLLERKADDKHAGRKKPAAGETKQDYDHVLLWLAGANETTKDAVADAARLKRTWTGAGVYPITVFWCSDFVEEILGVLDGVFSKAEARVGRTGAALDDAIESAVRGAGRAFLRDIKRRSALAAAWPAGDMADAVRRLGALKGRYRLHLAAEGVGAIMAADLATFPDEPGERGLPLFETVTLLSPVLTERRFDELLHSLPGKGGPKVAVVTHDDRTEQRMRVGPYSRSILHLVDRAFEEGPGNNTLVGLREVAERLRKRVDLDGRVAFGEAAASGVDQPKLHHVTRGPDAIRLLTARIGAHDRPFAAPCGPRPRHARAL